VGGQCFEVFVCTAKDVGGYGESQFKGSFGRKVGSRKVGGGWFYWSFVVVIIEEVVSKWAEAKEWINTEGESSNVFVQKELDLLS
jgi:hypothetical protein